jgi:hypothetical protein
MILSDSLKAAAGRWLDRSLPPVAVIPSPRLPWDEADPPHSTRRAACLLQRGETVRVDGRWREVARQQRLSAAPGPSQTLLFLTDGAILGSRFDFEYLSRDEAEQVAARLDGAL